MSEDEKDKAYASGKKRYFEGVPYFVEGNESEFYIFETSTVKALILQRNNVFIINVMFNLKFHLIVSLMNNFLY